MSAQMPLRERIAAVLAQHDPLHAGEHGGDLEAAYAVEADEIADVLGGVVADADQCAGVVWTVIARSVGVDVAGPVEAYADVGADVAALVEGSAGEPPALDDELDLEETLEDPLAVAILAVLIEHDPAPPSGAGDDAEEELRYQAAALDLVDVLAAAPAAAEVERDRERPRGALRPRRPRPARPRRRGARRARAARRPAPCQPARARAAARGVAPERSARRGRARRAGATRPRGAARRRRGPRLPRRGRGARRAPARGRRHGGAVRCRRLDRPAALRGPRGRTPIDGYAAVGDDIAQLVALHRELVERDPSLVEPVMPAVEDLLASEPLALRVLELIVEHDPLGFAAGGGAELEYLGDARLLAVLLADAPGRSECQVLAWKVLAEPNCGPFGGAVGRYRALGAALARLVRTA